MLSTRQEGRNTRNWISGCLRLQGRFTTHHNRHNIWHAEIKEFEEK